MTNPETLRQRLEANTDAVLCEVCRKPTGARIQKGAEKNTRGWCRIHARNLPPLPHQTGAAYMNPWIDNPE